MKPGPSSFIPVFMHMKGLANPDFLIAKKKQCI